MRRKVLIAVMVGAVLALMVGVTAGSVAGKTSQHKATKIVALLWPENVTPRWEGNDKPTHHQGAEEARSRACRSTASTR